MVRLVAVVIAVLFAAVSLGWSPAPAQPKTDGRPYARKDDLTEKNVVPQATYDKIKDQIIAKQNTAKKQDAKNP